MLHRHVMVICGLAILMTATILLSGCFNPRNTPFFKKASKDWEQKNARYIEEALKTSPVLQDIERLCTREIPLPEGFRLVSRIGTDKKKNPYLSYGYYAAADYKAVKALYEDYFTQNGWRVAGNREGGWGPAWHAVFRKDSYKVAVTYMRVYEEANYSFFCQKVFEEGE